MKEQNPTRKDESIKTDNEICEMCAKESEEPEKNIAQEENGCCCYRKTTARSQDERKKLMNRLSRIEGQIRGIKGMLEKDAYCNDILIQSAAVSAAHLSHIRPEFQNCGGQRRCVGKAEFHCQIR